tara:strand:+ start:824 stop:1771 length:948 start_codon:yes stop_codon:yes gene_type:complete
MKIIPEQKLLTSKLIFIGGVTRCGKSFLCPIVSSFYKHEMFFMSSVAENISYIDKLRGIDKNFSKFLVKLIFNELIYNLNIGRNLNFRKSDYTSIKKYKNPKMYLDRMLGIEGNKIIKRIKKDNNSYPIMFHDILINPQLLLECFKNSKIIFVDRHPVELIEEWLGKKYYGDFYKNPRNVTLSFNYDNANYPHWSLDQIKNIKSAKNNIEKTVFLLGSLILKQKLNFKKLSKKHKKRVINIKFDNLVSKSEKEIKKICKFLKTRPSTYTKEILNKEGGNREIDFSSRKKKRNKIIKKLSSKPKLLFEKIERIYEN